jgi:hypothetical protein
MSAYNQYGAPASYMSYPQGLPQGQHQGYGTAQQFQAMYSGMPTSYAQPPSSGGTMPTPGAAAPGSTPGLPAQPDMEATVRSFEQMGLGAPAATQMGAPNQMHHMSSYGQAAQTQAYPTHDYTRAAYMGAAPGAPGAPGAAPPGPPGSQVMK